MSYLCDSEDGNAAVMLVTNLEAGDVLALCPACFPEWVAGMHDAFWPAAAPARPVEDVQLPADTAAAAEDEPQGATPDATSGPDSGETAPMQADTPASGDQAAELPSGD